MTDPVSNTTSVEQAVRMWAVDLVQREAQELAIGSIRMGLQIAELFAQYVLTGAIPEDEVFDDEQS